MADASSPKANCCLHFARVPFDLPIAKVETQLMALCQPFGSVEAVHTKCFSGYKVARMAESGRLHTGHAFVVFETESSAHDALKHFTENEVCMTGGRLVRPLQVDVSRKFNTVATSTEVVDPVKHAEKIARQGSKARRRRRRWDGISAVLAKLGTEPSLDSVAPLYTALHHDDVILASNEIHWDDLHFQCDPQRAQPGLGKPDVCGVCGSFVESVRSRRKREQTQGFADILARLFAKADQSNRRLKVVDFGCGSGNMLLPLAAHFPHVDFVGVDMNKTSIELLRKKATEANLNNLTSHNCMIESFSDPMDVVVALHACGSATDHAMVQAAKHNAAFIISSCCVGKLKFSTKGGGSFSTKYRSHVSIQDQETEVQSFQDWTIEHPRSQWMRACLSSDEFETLAALADFHSDAKPAQIVSKVNVELDRARFMMQLGYDVALLRLTKEVSYPKNDCLVGVHPETNSARLSGFVGHLLDSRSTQ